MSEGLMIEIFDTTLRDGAQSLPEKHQFPQGSKVALADEIAKLGVQTIEAGFPASMDDGEEVAEVAATVGQTEYRVEPKSIENATLVELPPRLWTPVITGLARAIPEEIDQVWASVQGAKRPGIHTFVATAEEHMRAKHPKMTPEQILDMAVQAMGYAREVGGPEATVEFSCEAASTSDMATLERFVKSALDEDIDVINLPDTLGAASAKRMRTMFEHATRWVVEAGRAKDITIATHNHNDGERAVANSIEAAHAIIDTATRMGSPIPKFQVEVTSGHNLGERNGNTNLAPLIRNLLTDREEFGADIDIAIDTTLLKHVAELICAYAGLALDPNAAVIGRDTTAHRSGVHADAIIKGGAATYAAVDPRWFGHKNAAVIEDGKYQGANGKANLGATDTYKAETVMTSDDVRGRVSYIGLEVDDEQLEKITVRSNMLAREQERPIADTEIEQMVAEETGLPGFADQFHPEEIRITSLDKENEEAGSKKSWHVATVQIGIDGLPSVASSHESRGGAISAGVGAVNNALAAAPLLSGDFRFMSGDIDQWRGVSLEEGAGSAAGIYIVASCNGREVTAYAEDTSVDDASVKAYVKAIDLVRRIEQRERTRQFAGNTV